MSTRRSELGPVLILAAVQFVDVVDFTMILPLGPDFATALGMPMSALAYVAAAYTLFAAIAGLIGARYFDRVQRRRALTIATLGLSLATLAATLCTGMSTLILARALAGLCGGPAAALVQSLLADAVPEARRGRAMAIVLGANAIAAIAAVPAGLALAGVGGWQLPFIATGGLGLLVTAITLRLPAELGAATPADASTREHTTTPLQLRRPELWLGAWMIFATVASAYLLTPNLSAYVQFNLGLPRAAIPGLYTLGGLAALVSMQVFGALVDRFGALPIASLATVAFVAVVAAFVVAPTVQPPISLAFAVLLVSLAGRNVPVRTLVTKLPHTRERAGFLSSMSAVQHAAAAAGALLSAALLRDDEHGALIGLDTVGAIAIGVSLMVPLAVWLTERRLRDHTHR